MTSLKDKASPASNYKPSTEKPYPPSAPGTSPTSAGGRTSPPHPRIIQELFQDYNELGYKQSVAELDRALDEKCPLIVIEPLRLGDETARWIGVGNFLHKTTVVAGFGAIMALGIVPKQWYLWCPLTLTCAATYAGYSLSWQGDPASQYQVERDARKLADLKLNNLNAHSVVVLVRKNDFRRRVLHTSVAAVTFLVVGCHLYNQYCVE